MQTADYRPLHNLRAMISKARVAGHYYHKASSASLKLEIYRFYADINYLNSLAHLRLYLQGLVRWYGADNQPLHSPSLSAVFAGRTTQYELV